MIFNIVNAVIWVLVIGLLIVAHYFRHPLSIRRQITAGHVIRTLGVFIMLVWVLLIGFYHTLSSLFHLFGI